MHDVPDKNDGKGMRHRRWPYMVLLAGLFLCACMQWALDGPAARHTYAVALVNWLDLSTNDVITFDFLLRCVYKISRICAVVIILNIVVAVTPFFRIIETRIALAMSVMAFASIAWMLSHGLMPLMFGIYFGVVNLITFVLYAYDKAAAIRQRDRVSEFSLHMWSLMCGWPAAVLAQFTFHHKTRKLSFRVQHWAVLVVNLIAVYLIAKQSHFY